MAPVRTRAATGVQITLLIFAVLLLAVPLSTCLAELFKVASESQRDLLGRLVAFACGAVVIASFPALRRSAASMLSRPIPHDRLGEVLAVSLLRLPIALGLAGATAMWIWMTEGDAALEQRMALDPAKNLEYAFSTDGLVFFLFMGTLVAPVLEELVFRGFLYRAWERRWGWFPAMLGVSTVFAIYHPFFLHAFISSLVFVCIFRRTGTLWGPIVVHAVGNALLWYPLGGQFLAPSVGRAVGDISTWGLQLGCSFFLVIAVPAYVLVATRERN